MPFAAADVAGAVNDGVLDAITNGSGVVTTSLRDINYGVNSDPVHYDSANTWRSAIGNATPNDTLMNGYLDDGNDDQPFVNFALSEGALPLYTVVIYVHGNAADGQLGRYWIEEWFDPFLPGTVITDQVGITANEYAGTFLQAGSGLPQTLTPVNVDFPTGNYIVFEGLTARNIRVRGSGNGDPEGSGRGPINGVQILDFVNDPQGDDDDDDLRNGWELNFDLDPASGVGENGANGNPDGDGLTNLEEQTLGANPRLADTDGDGLDDEVETGTGVFTDLSNTGTDPLDRDSDDDGLLDGVETNDGNFISAEMTGSNPFDPDSDGDGLPDRWEVVNDLNPNDDGTTAEVNGPAGDPDEDFATNGNEFAIGTDPQLNDTDQDGLLDGYEDNTGTYVSATQTGTDPLDNDSDDDGLLHRVESNDGMFNGPDATGTSPLVRDSDGDGYFDNQEVEQMTDPNEASSRPSFPLPLAFWTFDDQGAAITADVSGNDNDATVVGEATYIEGHTGRPSDFAMSFDGVDDAATTLVSLNGLFEYTISGWVNVGEAQAVNAGIFGQNDVLESGFQVASVLRLWSNPGLGTDTDLAVTGEWIHLAYVGDAAGRTLYIDGEAIGIAGAGGAVPLGTSAFTFNMGGGGIFGPTGNFFQGGINDVAIWPVAFAPRLISGLADGSITPLPVSDGGLEITSFTRDEDSRITLTVGGTIPGVEYLVQESSTLMEADWSEITDFTGTADASVTTVIVSQRANAERERFFRVRVLEDAE